MTEENSSSRRKFRLRLWCLAVALFVVGAGALGISMLARGDRAARRLEALRAAGYPTSVVELGAYTQLPPGEPNAAEVYMLAFASYVPPRDDANTPLLGKATLPERGQPLPAPMAQAVAVCLESNRRTLALLHRAAGIEQCRYDWDYGEALLSWVGTQKRAHEEGVKNSALLLRLSAMSQACNGNAAGVVTSIKDGLRLSMSLRREPGNVQHGFQIATCAIALTSLECAMNLTTFSPQQLQDLDAALVQSVGALDLTRSLITERCFALECCQRSLPSLLSRPGVLSVRKLIAGRNGLPDVLDFMERYITASRLPYAERWAKFHEIDGERQNLSSLHEVVQTVLSTIGQVSDLDLRVRAHAQLARTALALERYRLANGGLPEQLPSLVPDFLDQAPIDPFDNQPIRYRRLETGYLLYSADVDGQDNGGRKRSDVKSGAPYDWCFIVGR